MFPSYVKSLLRLQRIFIEVLECPMGRLLDCMIALSTQTYQTFAETLGEEAHIACFTALAQNELKVMQAQKVTTFNPTLVSIALRLGNSEDKAARKIATKIAHFTFDTTASCPQIVTSELAQYVSMGDARDKRRPRLEYLQLAK